MKSPLQSKRQKLRGDRMETYKNHENSEQRHLFYLPGFLSVNRAVRMLQVLCGGYSRNLAS